MEDAALPSDAPDRLLKLYQRWREIAAEHPPHSEDFPFDAMVGEHPGLGLIEPAVSPEGRADYFYRRVGPEHKQRTGRKLQGHYFSDVLYAASIPSVMRAYGKVMGSGEPHYWESINLVHGSRPTTYVRLLLPLFDDDCSVTALLGSWVWRDTDASD